MRSLLSFAFLILFSLTTWANDNAIHAHEKVRHGMHGMLLFSDGDSLYASHLPMFYTPHDMQVVMRIELTNKQTQKSLHDALAEQGGYWTLAPERFDLTQLAQAGEHGIWQFDGDLYQGHFERGGKLGFKNQGIVIKEVVLRNQLESKVVPRSVYMRLTPDNADTHFYAQVIQGRPNVDRIFWVLNNKALPEKFSIEKKALLTNSADLAKALEINPEDVNIYYEERGDLK
ncbi:hypothetical protein [Pseudoalteromonas ruthenica]|uniref:hypothetical protein n=1 Tax=Pseudoalteromonas ruthenica TaxID=151081 RepID=UPI00110A820F|nr:hypothetical protein [Pseudoalteromonas ruthenica]TMO42445.1 hypothetical protein CWC24_17925 [Pseudoalteromonas ruthenica]TMO48446.1 hypothetical protein CWC23_17550 [Pseudoalteromonas ruthenica]